MPLSIPKSAETSRAKAGTGKRYGITVRLGMTNTHAHQEYQKEYRRAGEDCAESEMNHRLAAGKIQSVKTAESTTRAAAPR